jgi:hypothetical protein
VLLIVQQAIVAWLRKALSPPSFLIN